MSDRVRILLAQGIGAAKAGDVDEAEFYLKWVLRADPTREQEIRAWRWLAEISSDDDATREYIELILANDMGHAWARRQLAILDGRLKEDEIVDPDNLPAAKWEPEKVSAERFVCSECGGRMEYAADGIALICTYCGYKETADAVKTNIPEEDFIVGLARATGHRSPITMQSFTCEGCGASYLLAPETISVTCPFCATSYTVELTESRTLIPPTGIIPHIVDVDRATKLFHKWLQEQGMLERVRTSKPEGLYLPVWTFDIVGELQYRYQEYDRKRERFVVRESAKSILYDDVVVPACSALSPDLVDELSRFDHGRLIPYDSRLLANWPAELYQVSMADASIRARAHVVERERDGIERKLSWNARGLAMSSRTMHIDAYKLILVPVWVAHYTLEDDRFDVVINGQTGTVRGETPARGSAQLLGMLGRLFG